jgi:hypothetical protein
MASPHCLSRCMFELSSRSVIDRHPIILDLTGIQSGNVLMALWGDLCLRLTSYRSYVYYMRRGLRSVPLFRQKRNATKLYGRIEVGRVGSSSTSR